MLRIYGTILELLRMLRPIILEIERRDPDLARQTRRAADSMRSTPEGSGSQGRNRRARYFNALGSANETRACVEVALGYVGEIDAPLRAKDSHIVRVSPARTDARFTSRIRNPLRLRFPLTPKLPPSLPLSRARGRACVEVAAALGYIGELEAPLRARLNHVIGTLVRLAV